MLFNFHLLPIEDVSLFGYENQRSLHWFGLTDGWYWLCVGDDELFRYHETRLEKWKAAGETWDHLYVEYQVVRIWEDIQDILPSILEPIPAAIHQRCDPNQGIWQLFAQELACLESHDDHEAWFAATNWLSGRQLDTSYLVNAPRISIWTDGTTLHINWDNRDDQEAGIPTWSTQQGMFTMPLARFIDEVRSFDKRLITAMDERVKSAKAHWPLPDVEINLDFLEVEHRNRAMWMDQAFARAQMQHTDWDAVSAAIDAIEYKCRHMDR